MNEFIVWDEDNKEFVKSFKFKIDCDGELYYDGLIRMNSKYENMYKYFKYIGKTDIEGNKIYADCSIVEFDSFYQVDGTLEYKARAYLHFEEEELGYVFKVISIDGVFENNRDADYLRFYKNKVKNLKIIGNLQQNKELLDDSTSK